MNSNKGHDKPASKQYVLDMLGYSLNWSTRYIHAARMGDETQMELLNNEWEEYMKNEEAKL